MGKSIQSIGDALQILARPIVDVGRQVRYQEGGDPPSSRQQEESPADTISRPIDSFSTNRRCSCYVPERFAVALRLLTSKRCLGSSLTWDRSHLQKCRLGRGISQR